MKRKFMFLTMLLMLFTIGGFRNVVLAEEVKPSFEIISLTQGDLVLETNQEGVYVVDSVDENVYLNFRANNVNVDKYYSFTIENDGSSRTNSFSGNSLMTEVKKMYFDIDPKNDDLVYEITLCELDDEYNCVEELTYNTEMIKVMLSDRYDMTNRYLNIVEMKQGGKVIEPKEMSSNYYYYTINRFQDVYIKVQGENLVDDVIYYIEDYVTYRRKSYTGKELNEDGVEFVVPISSTSSFGVSWGLGELFYSLPVTFKHEDGNNYEINIWTEDSDEVQVFDFDMEYTNYPEIEIKNNSDDYHYYNYMIIGSMYHNSENTLSMKISGSNYVDDQEYDFMVLVGREGSESSYQKNIKLTGSQLKSGYLIELDDLLLEVAKTNTDLRVYEITLKDQYSTLIKKYKYTSNFEDNLEITANIYYGDGVVNLAAFKGTGDDFGGGGFYETFNTAFNNSSMYLRYLSENLDNSREYDYILEYGTYDNETWEFVYDEVLKTGKVSGLILNNRGLFFKVDNKNNYKQAAYRLTIKYNGEILCYGNPVIELVDYPTFANAHLVANGKSLYISTATNTYIATRNSEIDINVAGAGFDDDKEYYIGYGESFNYDSEESDNYDAMYKFTGYQLNNGLATIKLNKKIDSDDKNVSIYVWGDFEGVAQGGMTIEFVDSKDFFKEVANYVVDNTMDIIKNIKKQTEVASFSDNIEISDNGNILIYDEDEEIVDDEFVGTGMTARIVDEYEMSLFDMDVVVKGDVNGDGDLSLTDLIKVKQHLTETVFLDGVYEIAGNVTDTGEIGITDLVKMKRDVAEIEELK